MKKLLLLAFAFLALSVTFTSCSKDDDTPDSLVGTVWSTTFTYEYEGETYTNTITVSFKTATEYEMTYFDNNQIETGTYVYVKPKVTLDGIVEGTVKGNTMTVTLIQGVSQTFTRKK
jgi:hypothetical protein